MTVAPAEELRRELGLLDAVGVGVGAIIGAGIFVVTGVAAGVAGPALVISLALAAVAAVCNALSSAQLAAHYPQSGGTYEYGYQVLDPWLGFAAGWMFLAAKTAGAGTVALGLAGYLSLVMPGAPARWVAVSAIGAFTLLNYFGIKRSSVANLGIVVISTSGLLLFVLLGLRSFQPAHFEPFAPAGIPGVLEGAALLFFAYTGYARIATLAEEVREPERTIPRAIIITLVFTVVLYFAVAAVAVGTAGVEVLAAGAAPLHGAASATGVSWLAPVVAISAVTAMLGVILSQILGLSRMAFAMARRGDLPTALSAVHPVHGVPHRAILLIGLAAAVVAGTGTLAGVAAAASFSILIYYGIANLAALRMPREFRLFHDWVPALGLVMCASLALSLDGRTILTGLALLSLGLAGRLVFRGVRATS